MKIDILNIGFPLITSYYLHAVDKIRDKAAD